MRNGTRASGPLRVVFFIRRKKMEEKVKLSVIARTSEEGYPYFNWDEDKEEGETREFEALRDAYREGGKKDVKLREHLLVLALGCLEKLSFLNSSLADIPCQEDKRYKSIERRLIGLGKLFHEFAPPERLKDNIKTWDAEQERKKREKKEAQKEARP
jgi:hypothetical protein